MASRGNGKKARREAGERAKQLGKLAQKEVSLALSRAGLTVNEALEDEQGWDLFVQFPTSLEPASFLDFAPPAHSCLVQVKASDEAEPRVRMNLSNALKLAKAPTPAFVVVARMAGQEIHELWAIHCGPDFIERVLARAATVDADTALSINRVSLDIPLPNEAGIPAHAERLKAALLAHLEAPPARYFEEKQGWIRDVGYGPSRKLLRVKFRDDASDADYEELADFAVGLRERLPVRRIEVDDLRFGLERREKLIEQPELVWPTVPTGPGVEVVVDSGHGEVASLLCSSHLARAVFPFLPDRFERIVLRAPFFTFVAKRDDDKYVMTWSVDGLDAGLALASLSDAARAARCVRLIRKGNCRLSVKGLTKRAVALGAMPAPSADGGLNLRMIEDLELVVPVMNLPADTRFAMATVEAQSQRLRILAAALSGDATSVASTFPPTALPDAPALGDSCALLMVPWVRFGDRALVCVVAIVGLLAPAKDPAEQTIKAGALRLLAKRLFDQKPDDIDALYSEAEAILEAEGVKRVYRPS